MTVTLLANGFRGFDLRVNVYDSGHTEFQGLLEGPHVVGYPLRSFLFLVLGQLSSCRNEHYGYLPMAQAKISRRSIQYVTNDDLHCTDHMDPADVR
jgi:hypothetical protein